MKSRAGAPGPCSFGRTPLYAGARAPSSNARPVAPDRGVERRAARRIDGVVDRLGRIDVEPLDVGTEARLAGEVERQVDAEAAGLGHRIDQAGERRAAGERVVVAFGEAARAGSRAGSRPPMRRAIACACRPAALTSTPRCELERRVAADAQHEAVAARHRALAAASARPARRRRSRGRRGRRACSAWLSMMPVDGREQRALRSAAPARARAPRRRSASASPRRRWRARAARSCAAPRPAPASPRRPACRSADAATPRESQYG